MPRKYHSLSDAAKLLGVSTDTIRRWDRDRRINVARDERNRRIVAAEEIDRLHGDLNRPTNTARNHLSCTVTDIALDGLMAQVEMVVSGPARIVAVVTRDAAQELRLHEGAPVTAIVSESAVMISA
jgi:molybdopterin-binding protein